ncbi:MAG: hypothetical protein DWQ08_08900, partial [Proteobacteria bacterium]
LVLIEPPATVAFVVLVVDLISNVAILPSAIRLASYRTVGLTVVSSCAAIPLGNAIMLTGEPIVVRAFIYLTVGFAALVLMTGLRFPRPLRSWELVASGAAAGGMMGTTALGIAIIPVLLSTPDALSTSRANIIVWVFFAGAVLLAILAWNGGATGREALIALALAPGYSIGAWFGKSQFSSINEAAFRKWVLRFLLVISVLGLVSLGIRP